jgi:hypothetical protein
MELLPRGHEAGTMTTDERHDARKLCARVSTSRHARAVVWITLVLGAGCMQPKTSVDEFGTGGASTVTGDEPLDQDNIDSEDAAVEPEPEPPASEQRADAAAMPSTRPEPTDAAVRVDAATPVLDAGAPVTRDASVVAPPPSTLSKLTFSVQTASAGGKYSPRNIYAIWVVDAEGKFVKTLAKFARTRQVYLTGWSRASSGNVVDAVTGATMTSHGLRTVTWDLTNAAGQPVADGDYKIVLELTDADRTGPTTSVSFTKGSEQVELTPPDAASFTNMSLVLD